MQAIEPRQNLIKAALYSVGAVYMLLIAVILLWLFVGSAIHQEFPNGRPPVPLAVGLMLLAMVTWPCLFAIKWIHKAAQVIGPVPNPYHDSLLVTFSFIGFGLMMVAYLTPGDGPWSALAFVGVLLVPIPIFASHEYDRLLDRLALHWKARRSKNEA